MADATAGSETTADALIIGGGLVGAATALALAMEGVRAIVADPTPLDAAMAPEFDGRGYAIALASRRFLGRLGVWPAVAPHAQPINDILVSDGRVGEGASPLFLHFDHRELGAEGFGHMVEDHHLRVALLEAARSSDAVRYLDGAGVEELRREAAGVTARLTDGRELRAAVAIACDGKRSRAAAEAGIRRVEHVYDQVGLVCAVAHERPHHGVAHEYFLPAGPFAILPLTGDRATLVWTERADMAEALRAADDATYLAEIQKRFGAFLGEVRLIGRRWAYPLSLSVAERFTAPRLALAGDAARAIHPIAGQGLNYGLRDAAAAGEALGGARARGEDLGAADVLERYQRMRRADSWAIAAATHGLNLLFSNDLGPVRAARRLGLAAFGAVGPLRRAAMRFAAGDRSDLPKRMR